MTRNLHTPRRRSSDRRNPIPSSFSSTHLRRPSWRCEAWRQLSKRQRPNHAGEDGGRERPQPALSERVHRLVRPLVRSGFAWGFLGTTNVQSWGRRGCRCTGAARSCGAGWRRSATLSPAGSVDRAPKWAPRVGGTGWLKSTSQLKVATADLSGSSRSLRKRSGPG